MPTILAAALVVLLLAGSCIHLHPCDFPDVEPMEVRPFASEEELREFLRQDKTNENEYIRGVYDCNEFSHDLMYAAREKGFDMWVYPHKDGWQENGRWHAANCTRIGKWYWHIEPQTDHIKQIVAWHGDETYEMQL